MHPFAGPQDEIDRLGHQGLRRLQLARRRAQSGQVGEVGGAERLLAHDVQRGDRLLQCRPVFGAAGAAGGRVGRAEDGPQRVAVLLAERDGLGAQPPGGLLVALEPAHPRGEHVDEREAERPARGTRSAAPGAPPARSQRAASSGSPRSALTQASAMADTATGSCGSGQNGETRLLGRAGGEAGHGPVQVPARRQQPALEEVLEARARRHLRREQGEGGLPDQSRELVEHGRGPWPTSPCTSQNARSRSARAAPPGGAQPVASAWARRWSASTSGAA